MRIGIDAHMIGERETGNETYHLGLLDGFARLAVPVHAYATRHLQLPPHAVHRVIPHQSLVRIPVSTPLLTLRDRLDLYHASYVLPPWLPCYGVVAVHDLTYELFPDWFAPRVQRMLSLLVPWTLRRADAIITISENSKRDLVQVYGLAPERIAVTYLAPRPAFSDALPRRTTEPFFLYVGNIQPRKNIEVLVRAQQILRGRGLKIPLLVAGQAGLRSGAAISLAQTLGVSDLVRFLGYIEDAELRALYASCTALVHPAWYEGFGLTVAEGMAQGAPVLASRTSAIPEVTGDAALLLDPANPEVWADAMQAVAEDKDLQQTLSAAGRQRSQMFSWERCARETLSIYRQVTGGP